MFLPVVIVTAIGIVAGVILAIASKIMAVEEDPMFGLLRAELPGANCGACGYAGCDDYANALAADRSVAANLCTPGGAGVVAKLCELLGVEAADITPKQAIVHCFGTKDCTSRAVDYVGPRTCGNCKALFGGDGSCTQGCMGLGDCVRVCDYDAIRVIDGVAVVDPARCTACGLCVKACPSALITIVPMNSQVYVGCSNTQRGAVCRKQCTVSCIACKMCEKACEFDAVKVEDNLARIDPEKCTNCGACVAVCPTSSIRGVMYSKFAQPKLDKAASE